MKFNDPVYLNSIQTALQPNAKTIALFEFLTPVEICIRHCHKPVIRLPLLTIIPKLIAAQPNPAKAPIF
jgi:hypothetical protein